METSILNKAEALRAAAKLAGYRVDFYCNEIGTKLKLKAFRNEHITSYLQAYFSLEGKFQESFVWNVLVNLEETVQFTIEPAAEYEKTYEGLSQFFEDNKLSPS